MAQHAKIQLRCFTQGVAHQIFSLKSVLDATFEEMKGKVGSPII